MALFVEAIRKESKNLLKNGIKTRIVGDKSKFPSILQSQIAKVEELTKDCEVMTLNIAANYGGRWDVLNASRNLLKDCLANGTNPDDLTEDDISQRLNVISNVDLMIRTGGEQRISNFLLWQSAYAELYFSKTLWPDYGADDLIEAIEFFNGRERRFGMTSAQVQAKGELNAD